MRLRGGGAKMGFPVVTKEFWRIQTGRRAVEDGQSPLARLTVTPKGGMKPNWLERLNE
jgi:hypothetical protein